MKRIFLKAALTTLVATVASIALVAILLPAMGGEFAGNIVVLAAVCPVLIAFPTASFVFWQNERLAVLHDDLNATHAALQEAHAKLADKARRDAMTGFLNRESFFATLDGTRRRSDRGSLLLVDADHFKRINDQHGHLVGDDALVRIARAIARAVREGDVIGRIGGEEFAVFLAGADEDEAQRIGERIRREVETVAFAPAPGHPLALTVSVGGTMCGSEASVSDLMRAADDRLYEAKNAGRNRVVFDADQRWAA